MTAPSGKPDLREAVTRLRGIASKPVTDSDAQRWLKACADVDIASASPDPLAEKVAEQETELAKLATLIGDMSRVGGQMANLCFNLAQVEGQKCASTMDELCREWDAIMGRE